MQNEMGLIFKDRFRMENLHVKMEFTIAQSFNILEDLKIIYTMEWVEF